MIHNQHVIAWLGKQSRELDRELSRYSMPHGNIASPARYEARLAGHRLVIECIRQSGPEYAATLCWTPRHFH